MYPGSEIIVGYRASGRHIANWGCIFLGSPKMPNKFFSSPKTWQWTYGVIPGDISGKNNSPGKFWEKNQGKYSGGKSKVQFHREISMDPWNLSMDIMHGYHP